MKTNQKRLHPQNFLQEGKSLQKYRKYHNLSVLALYLVPKLALKIQSKFQVEDITTLTYLTSCKEQKRILILTLQSSSLSTVNCQKNIYCILGIIRQLFFTLRPGNIYKDAEESVTQAIKHMLDIHIFLQLQRQITSLQNILEDLCWCFIIKRWNSSQKLKQTNSKGPPVYSRT